MSVSLTHLARNLTYSNQSTVPDLLADLAMIAEFDRTMEAKRKRLGRLLAVGFVALIASFVALGAGLQTIAVPAIIICGLGLIALGILLRRLGWQDLPNDRYVLLQTLLELLSRDAEPEALFQVNLVLSQPTSPHKKQSTEPHPHRSGWKIDRFEDEWLQVQGSLLDGNELALYAMERCITQYGWKRGRSGKSKYKTKTKSKGQDLTLNLTFSRRKYGAIALLSREAEAAIRLPAGVQLKRLKLDDHHISLSVKVPAQPADRPISQQMHQTITLMFLSLYQILNLARKLSKNTRAQGEV